MSTKCPNKGILEIPSNILPVKPATFSICWALANWEVNVANWASEATNESCLHLASSAVNDPISASNNSNVAKALFWSLNALVIWPWIVFDLKAPRFSDSWFSAIVKTSLADALSVLAKSL